MKAFRAFSKLDLKQAMMRLTTTAILAWMVLFFAAAPSSAAEAKVNFAYSALDASYTAYWMAVEKGFFERYGVALGKSVYISGASILMGSMASGEIDAALVPANGPMNVQLSGGDITIFAATLNLLPYYVFFSKSMTQLKDIEGRRAGISQFGSGLPFWIVSVVPTGRNKSLQGYLCSRWGHVKPSGCIYHRTN
jgi:ABC-type nitrate/sulfonate/bicarbonate transport system substrate-binding protein